MPSKNDLTKTPLWNMSNEKEVFDFIDDLQMKLSNDQLMTAGFILLLKEITQKESHVGAIDFCDHVINHLFSWTACGDEARRQYLKTLASRPVSDFVNQA